MTSSLDPCERQFWLTRCANVYPSKSTKLSDYWEEYTKTSTCSDTRYCTSQRVVVLCIAIDDCYRKAVAEAFCGIEVNPCSNICENSEFLKAMKMRVVMDGLHFAACAHDWTTAEKHMDILKTLCCCN